VKALSRALKGMPPAGLESAFEISRSLPHGQVAAMLGTIRELASSRPPSSRNTGLIRSAPPLRAPPPTP
jgi:hypothetical protein